MSQFLENLLKRNLIDTTTVRPRLLSKFESYTGPTDDLETNGQIDQYGKEVSNQTVDNSQKHAPIDKEFTTAIHNSNNTAQNNINQETNNSILENEISDEKAQESTTDKPGKLNSNLTLNHRKNVFNIEDVKSDQAMRNDLLSLKGETNFMLPKSESETRDLNESPNSPENIEFSFRKENFPSFLESTISINPKADSSNIIIEDQTSNNPTIKVSIGRIEVKASIEKPQRPATKKTVNKPKMSLQDYLEKQKKTQ